MAIVEDIVRETVEKLNLLAKKNRQLDKAVITDKIKEIISDAFKQVGSQADKKELYKKIALEMHPDKLKSNDTLYNYLESNDLINFPMTTLGEAYLKKNEVTPDAVTALAGSIFNSTLNALLRYPVILRELTFFIFVFVFVSVVAGMVIAIIPIVIISNVISLVLSTPERFLLNAITQNKYDEVINEGSYRIDGARNFLIERGVNAAIMADDDILAEFKIEMFAKIVLTIKTELFLNLRDRYKAQNIDTTMMDDDQLQADNEEQKIAPDLVQPLKLDSEGLFKYNNDQKVTRGEPAKTADEIIDDALNTIETEQKNAKNQGFTHVKFVFYGFMMTLGRPWPAGIAGKIGSFIVRVPQFIAAVTMVPVAIAIEIIKFAIVTLPLVLIVGVSLTAILVTDIILAGPVFVWDGLNALFNQPDDEEENIEEGDLDENLDDNSSIHAEEQSTPKITKKLGFTKQTPKDVYDEALAPNGTLLFRPIDKPTIIEADLKTRTRSPNGGYGDID